MNCFSLLFQGGWMTSACRSTKVSLMRAVLTGVCYTIWQWWVAKYILAQLRLACWINLNVSAKSGSYLLRQIFFYQLIFAIISFCILFRISRLTHWMSYEMSDVRDILSLLFMIVRWLFVPVPLFQDDLLSLKVGSVLHHLSIKRAIQVLRLNFYEPSCLRRRPSDEVYDG